ncbi:MULTISPECIES: HesA/MoeB/ThiF family protein [Eikenella]|uniref:Molybdopterin-synthase adenylyltransferase MoeB n=1 Tax=Eikenella longinqua TaxID=1795827 RepID=A0A1A9S2B0_9NEIS|nr:MULTISPECIES: HesA/MoeB/ThiF family protein [Eikenella]OAM30816.1 molybdopterin-synthase adenylyltransferase MoeB [Eikenella longinqua]
MNDRQLLRYSRHILLDEIGIEGQQKLLDASVLVLGCGGLGSAALPYLAAAGVGRLLIADHDLIDDTNLQRQITYREADIGRPKADAMAGHLKQLNPACQIETYGKLGEAELLRLLPQCQVALDCSDNFATRQALNAAACATRTPLVSGAATRFDGQITVYRPDLPGQPCYACLFDSEQAGDGACALFGVFAPLVGIIGSSQAADALKILLGLPAEPGVLRCYHALSGRWQHFAIPKNPKCRVCGGERA